MEARRAASENVSERKWHPMSPSDPIYFHAPANVSSGTATFDMPSPFRMPFPVIQPVPRFDNVVPTSRPLVSRSIAAPAGLHRLRNGVDLGPNLNFPIGSMIRGVGIERGERVLLSCCLLYSIEVQSAPNLTSRAADDEVPDTETPVSELNEAPVDYGTSAREFEPGRHSSGKRKKDVSKYAHAFVSAMNSFSESFVSVEEKREERDSQKQKFTVESEERHFKWMMDSEEHRENTNEDLLVLLMMMATTMLLVQLLMDKDSSDDELTVAVGSKRSRPAVQTSTLEDSYRSLKPVAMQIVNCLIASGCVQEGSWWVRERSLIWFDYFLMKAFEDFRWRSYVAVLVTREYEK
ncbi:hypothetical protein R1sor_020500 [Riccia sorocarpa]|uniref:Uncharacterized protein n=1 Tax=Riccia sorocarpa TaxID=122646 RepID=A0ABD3IFG3_9MARC